MVGKTHRMVGMAFMTVGFEAMKHQGVLIHGIDPLLQLAVMYPPSQFGSVLPDDDHAWPSVPNKMPFNWVVHKLLHLSRPKHRSWQTHSILVTGGSMFLLYILVTYGYKLVHGITSQDLTIIRLLSYGLILGLSSHLFADFLNPSGIHLIPGFKIRAVPKTKFFATGGTWETKVIYPLSLVVLAISSVNILLGEFNSSLLSLYTKLHFF